MSVPMAMPHGLACLMTRDGGLVEVAGGPARRVGIDVVVVRHLLAMQLLSVREATSRAGDAIEGRWLMRVLPVPETGDLLPRPSHPTREAGALTEIADNVAHPARHGYVVGRGMDEGRSSKSLPLSQRETTRRKGFQELRILAGEVITATEA
jgi:hypothetical protein